MHLLYACAHRNEYMSMCVFMCGLPLDCIKTTNELSKMSCRCLPFHLRPFSYFPWFNIIIISNKNILLHSPLIQWSLSVVLDRAAEQLIKLGQRQISQSTQTKRKHRGRKSSMCRVPLCRCTFGCTFVFLVTDSKSRTWSGSTLDI